MKLSHNTLGSTWLTAVLLVMSLSLSLLSKIVAVVPIVVALVALVILMVATAFSAATGLEALGAKALVKVVLFASLWPRALVLLSFLFDAVGLRLRLLTSLRRLTLSGNDRWI